MMMDGMGSGDAQKANPAEMNGTKHDHSAGK
jgi:hypothetical protein